MKKSALTTEEISLSQRGARLRLLRNIAGLTQAKFSEICDVSEPSIRLWEKSQATILSEKGAAKIIHGLKNMGIDCSLNWLLSGIGEPPMTHLSAALTTQVETDEQTISFGSLQPEITLFSKSHSNSLITIVEDSAMEPILQKNDIVGGIKLYGEAMAHGVNKICIVEDANKNIFVRKIITNLSKHFFRLGITNLNINATEAPIIDAKLLSLAIVARVWRNTN